MRTKQTIAVIGESGKIELAVARSLCKGNYRFLLFAADTDKFNDWINDIAILNSIADVETVCCSYTACWEADIIIMTVSLRAENEIAEKIREVVNQKIVISIASSSAETSESPNAMYYTRATEDLQQLLPDAKVIKAFNVSFNANFEFLLMDAKHEEVFLKGSDQEALDTASELLQTAGFNPVILDDPIACSIP